ncbi:uncharacterized protein PG998_008678 [Apiospora kogelbergensis]|uniref:uncharacterized protein n=1 Tax=Apiospora kogelbergensis TaxID=1337665 RepID=UPI00312EADC0
MKIATVVLCLATAALGMPTGADLGATAAGAEKQLSGKGAAANKGTPAAAAARSSSATSSAAVPSATGGKGNGNNNNNSNKGGNGNAANATGPISESVIPDYGLAAGVPSKSQPGSCLGANNINIPCTCPPSKAAVAATLTTFVARGKAGSVPISFPDPAQDTSLAANRARINAIVNTLQNFNFDKTGPSPDLAAVQKKLQGGENVQVGSAGAGAAAGGRQKGKQTKQQQQQQRRRRQMV